MTLVARLLALLLPLLLATAMPASASDLEPPWVEGEGDEEKLVLHHAWSAACPICLESNPQVEALAAERPWLIHRKYEVNNQTEVAAARAITARTGETPDVVPAFMLCGTLLEGWGAAEREILVRTIDTCRQWQLLAREREKATADEAPLMTGLREGLGNGAVLLGLLVMAIVMTGVHRVEQFIGVAAYVTDAVVFRLAVAVGSAPFAILPFLSIIAVIAALALAAAGFVGLATAPARPGGGAGTADEPRRPPPALIGVLVTATIAAIAPLFILPAEQIGPAWVALQAADGGVGPVLAVAIGQIIPSTIVGALAGLLLAVVWPWDVATRQQSASALFLLVGLLAVASPELATSPWMALCLPVAPLLALGTRRLMHRAAKRPS